ncbi:hypothetical protein EC957_011911 [Mortierella hygrophila]|uniref:Uncharacterized protein n=1 Tax=Mortierella hygrophila TaxID=979708 RepID=A0A9P6K3U2_9FUNG|nr:hypothetical protein EC957_011911 [Mortierella hygrophila]
MTKMLGQRNVIEQRLRDDTKGSSQVSSSASTPHLNDASTVAHGPPSEIIDRVYVTITGPTSLGEATGSMCEVYLRSEGNIACTRPKVKTQWHIHRQGNPKPYPILADDQRFINHDRLESDAMSKAFWIHKKFEYFLNNHLSLYREYRSKCALEATVTSIQEDVDDILVDIPESVVLIRCDVPFYDSVDLESRVVIEHVVVEYFRSPWQLNWKHRVRSALVQKRRPWFKSVTGEEDEVFPDGPLPNGCIAQSLDASTSPVVANQTPAATVSPSASDDLMDFYMPLSTAAGPADTASPQNNAFVYLFDTPFLLDQVYLHVNPADLLLESTSDSNPEVTDIAYAHDGDDDTGFESMDGTFVIDYSESFLQESAMDHPIETDSNAVTNKKVDNPLPHDSLSNDCTKSGHIRVCENCGKHFTRKPSPKDLNAMDRCPHGAGGLHNFILYDPKLYPLP